MAPTCFECGTSGHIAADCPNAEASDKRPPHCGICDPRTRQVTVDLERGTVRRCPDCSPSRHKLLAQHKRCTGCKMVVYTWDSKPCGNHDSPVAPDRRMTIEQIREIERANS